MKIILISSIVILSSGCAIDKPLTREDAANFPTAISLAENKYNVKGALSNPSGNQRNTSDYNEVSFTVGTSQYAESSPLNRFLNDFGSYCQYQGGEFKTTREFQVSPSYECRKNRQILFMGTTRKNSYFDGIASSYGKRVEWEFVLKEFK